MADLLEPDKTPDSCRSSNNDEGNKDKSTKQRTKRPDLQVYVPRGKRLQEPSQIVLDRVAPSTSTNNNPKSVASSLSLREKGQPNLSSPKKSQKICTSEQKTGSKDRSKKSLGLKDTTIDEKKTGSKDSSKKSLGLKDSTIDRCSTTHANIVSTDSQSDATGECSLQNNPLPHLYSGPKMPVKVERLNLNGDELNDVLTITNNKADSCSTSTVSPELLSSFCNQDKSAEHDIAMREGGENAVHEFFYEDRILSQQKILISESQFSNCSCLSDVAACETMQSVTCDLLSNMTSFLSLHEHFQDCDSPAAAACKSSDMYEKDSDSEQDGVYLSAVHTSACVQNDDASLVFSPCPMEIIDNDKSGILTGSEIVNQEPCICENFNTELSYTVEMNELSTSSSVNTEPQLAESNGSKSPVVLKEKFVRLLEKEEVFDQDKKQFSEVPATMCNDANDAGMVDDDDWEHIFDESGEARNSELVPNHPAEKKSIKESGVTSTSYIDYYSYEARDPDVSCIDCGHLIEIYDFPVAFQTCDLLAAFLEYKDRGFDVKWVDDTHAIGIFSSTIAEFLQPYKARPETTASVARNLVTGALGLQNRVSKEKREEERRKLKEARERKKEVVKLKDEAWDGTISTS